VSLADFLRDEPLGNPPRELGVRRHWLAVDGVQPAVAENPASAGEAAAMAAASAGGGEEGGDPLLQVDRLRSGLLSEELLLYYDRVAGAVARPDRQDAVLAALAADAGLQELVPFLVRHCQRELYRSVAASDNDAAYSSVRLARSLLSNPNLHLELHLHELLPALVTCVVSQMPAEAAEPAAGSAAPSQPPTVSCWSLKREAADVLAAACDAFGGEYATLRSRVLKMLCRASAADRPLPSRYGGLAGVAALGPRAAAAFLVGPSAVWFADFDAALEADGRPPPAGPGGAEAFRLSDADRCGVQMCQRAILDAAGMVLRRLVGGGGGRGNNGEIGGGDDGGLAAAASEMRALQGVLGDKWVAFGCCVGDGYADCFV
jgi:transcription initiation factor TFIID subunit 6